MDFPWFSMMYPLYITGDNCYLLMIHQAVDHHAQLRCPILHHHPFLQELDVRLAPGPSEMGSVRHCDSQFTRRKKQVVGGFNFQPLWKIWVNWDDDIPNIWKNKSHIPNHQPDKFRLSLSRPPTWPYFGEDLKTAFWRLNSATFLSFKWHFDSTPITTLISYLGVSINEGTPKKQNPNLKWMTRGFPISH